MSPLKRNNMWQTNIQTKQCTIPTEKHCPNTLHQNSTKSATSVEFTNANRGFGISNRSDLFAWSWWLQPMSLNYPRRKSQWFQIACCPSAWLSNIQYYCYGTKSSNGIHSLQGMERMRVNTEDTFSTCETIGPHLVNINWKKEQLIYPWLPLVIQRGSSGKFSWWWKWARNVRHIGKCIKTLIGPVQKTRKELCKTSKPCSAER